MSKEVNNLLESLFDMLALSAILDLLQAAGFAELISAQFNYLVQEGTSCANSASFLWTPMQARSRYKYFRMHQSQQRRSYGD